MRTIARLILVAFLSLGFMAGCATTEEDTGTSAAAAEQAIAEAKAANEEAKAAGYAWPSTADLIKQAEEAYAAGKYDEAVELANKALKEAQAALAQAAAAKKQLDGSNADKGALSGSADSLAQKNKGAGSTAGKVTSYSVSRGDSLWTISGKDAVYANPYQWPLIYKTNRSQIKDADLINPGQVFDIDQNASSAEIDAAVQHAKTRGAWSVGDVEQSDLNYLNK
jgi:nucleoid-associated protein YgaU